MRSALIGKTIYVVVGHNNKSIGTIVYADDKIVAFCDYCKNGLIKHKVDRTKFNYILSEDVVRVKKVSVNSKISEEINKYDISEYKTIKVI